LSETLTPSVLDVAESGQPEEGGQAQRVKIAMTIKTGEKMKKKADVKAS